MTGVTFTSQDQLQTYTEWVEQQVCYCCGKTQKDRPRDSDGNLLDTWFSETYCGCDHAPANPKA